MNLRVPRPNLEKVEDGGQYDARGIQSGSKDKDLRGEWTTAKTLEVRVDNSFRSAPRPSARSDVIFQHCQGAQKTTTDAENIFLGGNRDGILDGGTCRTAHAVRKSQEDD